MERSRQIAACLTFLIIGLLMVWLLVAKLHVQPLSTPVSSPTSIVMGAESAEDEFLDVELLNPPLSGDESAAPAQTTEDMDNESQPGAETGVDLKSDGHQGSPAKTVTSERPSTVKEKTKPNPERTGNPLEQKTAREKATAQRTNNELANAFAKAANKNNALNKNEDTDNAGKKNGNPSSAAGPNAKGSQPGVSGQIGGGWKMPVYSRNIPSNEVGHVTFEIVVNRDGSVGKITQIDNKGLTSATIALCRSEIQRHKFTHPNPTIAEPATARVTFTFVDP